MKKIIKFITILILMIPSFINAKTIEPAIKYANEYLLNLKHSDRYIHTKSNTRYELIKDALILNEKFKTGGFISTTEYELSQKYPNNYVSSYLYDGTNFWTLTKVDEEENVQEEEEYNYYIDQNGFIPSTITTSVGVKTTAYVKKDIMVTGDGSKNKPYHFMTQSYVTIVTNNPLYGTIGRVEIKKDNNGKTIINTIENNLNNITLSISQGKNAAVSIKAKPGYKYLNSTCQKKSRLDNDGNLFIISNIVTDTTCRINFGYDIYKIVLDNNCPYEENNNKTLYLSYKDGWFNDELLEEALGRIQIPTCKGKNFVGYVDNNDKYIINSSGIILPNNTSSFTKDSTIKAKWQ